MKGCSMAYMWHTVSSPPWQLQIYMNIYFKYGRKRRVIPIFIAGDIACIQLQNIKTYFK